MATQDDTQHQEQDTGTVTPEAGSDDEAIARFNQRAQSSDAEDADPPNDEAQADPEDGTQETGDPDDEDEASSTRVEVEFEGKTYKVEPELQKALLRQADYSRHVQDVTAQKKDYAQRIERADSLFENSKKYASAQAAISALDAKLKEFEDADLDKLAPEVQGRVALDLYRVQQARAKAVENANSVHAQIVKDRESTLDAARNEMVKTLSKELPGWGDELGGRITAYALKSGYSQQDLARLTDPKVVIALSKAMKFDAIQAGKKDAIDKAKAKGETNPVLKPQQRRVVDKQADLQQRFKRSQSPEDAEALFHAKAQSRR